MIDFFHNNDASIKTQKYSNMLKKIFIIKQFKTQYNQKQSIFNLNITSRTNKKWKYDFP